MRKPQHSESVRAMTDAEASRHEGRLLEVYPDTPAAPDLTEGRRTKLVTPFDDRDRLHGELIAAAVARDADQRLATLVAEQRATRARLERDTAELAEAMASDARLGGDADAFEAASGGRSTGSRRMTMLGTASVLGVLAAAEAALNYPGFKYALPAPETPGVIGALLPTMPAFAAISVGLACAVAQKVVGSELAAAHRGLIAEPPAASDPYAG